MSESPAIEVEQLVRRVPQGTAGGGRHRPRGLARGDLRFPRAKRRGQVDHRLDADHTAAADQRDALASAGTTSSARAQGARHDRRRAPGGGARPDPHRPRAPDASGHPPGAAGADAPARAELLERVGLSEAADRRVGGYSGGMKRRLDLALALVHRRESCSSTSRRPAWTSRAGPRCGRRSRGSPTTRG